VIGTPAEIIQVNDSFNHIALAGYTGGSVATTSISVLFIISLLALLKVVEGEIEAEFPSE